MQVGAIEKVEDFAPALDSHLLAEEERDIEVLLKREVEVVVSRLVIRISTKVAFLPQSWCREVGGNKETVQKVLLLLPREMVAEGRSIGNIPVIPVGIVVTPGIPDDVAAGVKDRLERRSRIHRERQSRLQNPDSTELPSTQ